MKCKPEWWLSAKRSDIVFVTKLSRCLWVELEKVREIISALKENMNIYLKVIIENTIKPLGCTFDSNGEEYET